MVAGLYCSGLHYAARCSFYFMFFPSPALNMQNQVNTHSCRTDALEMRYMLPSLYPTMVVAIPAREKRGGTVLTDNAKG